MIDQMRSTGQPVKWRVLRRGVPFVAALLVFIAGCEGLLDVKNPDIVTPDDLEGAAGLATLRAGALGDLALALSGSAAGHGGTPGLILYTGSMSDEMVYSGTFPTRREYDQRIIQRENVTNTQVYQLLHRARVAAQNAADQITLFSPDLANEPMFAETRSLEALTYVFFGETFCSGTPFSNVDKSGELTFGEPQTTEEMFQAAVSRFDLALDNTGGSAEMGYLAAVGKGRALLNLGMTGEAATAVSSVPTDFTYWLEHSVATPGQSNGIYIMSAVRRQYSVADGEGINGLMFRSANDPRVPWEDRGETGQDDQTPYFNQLKYPDENASVALATGVEARLIEAEAALASPTTFEMIHNILRATMGLAPIDADTMTLAQREDFHFSERAFWMWATGHRTGDLRRLVREFGRGPELVFPTGAYFKGGDYGPDLNFIVPIEEENNPNFSGCIDRGA
jgi:hypothetical protein